MLTDLGQTRTVRTRPARTGGTAATQESPRGATQTWAEKMEAVRQYNIAQGYTGPTQTEYASPQEFIEAQPGYDPRFDPKNYEFTEEGLVIPPAKKFPLFLYGGIALVVGLVVFSMATKKKKVSVAV